MMKLFPTLDRVAIEREDSETQTEGGIILPDKSQKESNYGIVLAVGQGGFNADGTRRPMGIKVGDRVLFTDYHTTTTGSKVVICDEEDILAVARD